MTLETTNFIEQVFPLTSSECKTEKVPINRLISSWKKSLKHRVDLCERLRLPKDAIGHQFWQSSRWPQARASMEDFQSSLLFSISISNPAKKTINRLHFSPCRFLFKPLICLKHIFHFCNTVVPKYNKNIARIANADQVTLWLSVNHLNRCLCSHCSHCSQCLLVSTSVY